MDTHTEALRQYIYSQRQAGVSDEALSRALMSSGWPPEIVNELLGVPLPSAHMSPGDVVAAPKRSDSNAQHSIFAGRIGRLGYLLGGLYPLLILVSIAALTALVGHSRIVSIVSLLIGMAVIVAIIPLSISLHIRRWHDLGQTGWLILLGFIPLINIIVAILLLILPGTKGHNEYGDRYGGSFSPRDIYGLR